MEEPETTEVAAQPTRATGQHLTPEAIVAEVK